MSKCKIEIQNLGYEIGQYTILEDINIKIESGQFLALIGPNGGGKTTFIKLILGLISPSKGSIIVNGNKVPSIQAGNTGYVPQIKSMNRLFPALAYELVATGIYHKWVRKISSSDMDLILEALGKVGAEHLAEKQVSKLSGGELQRIYLARGFIRQPKLLLLDEPATGVDIVGENDIYNIIEQYRSENDSIVIMVTHDWEAAYHHADYVLLLNHKQICFDHPQQAFTEENLRKAFSHVGHKHDIVFQVGKND